MTERVKRALAMLSALAREYEAIASIPDPELTPPQKTAVRELATREDVLASRTRDLVERLRYLFQLFPSLDPKIVNNIAEAGTFMGEATHELGGLRPGQAIPPEQEAINRLSESSQQMQQAMQRLAQRGQFGRVPLVHVFRRGRFLPSGQFLPPTGTPEFPDHDIDENLTGLDTEKFKLPGKDDYKPEAFSQGGAGVVEGGSAGPVQGTGRALFQRIVAVVARGSERGRPARTTVCSHVDP